MSISNPFAAFFHIQKDSSAAASSNLVRISSTDQPQLSKKRPLDSNVTVSNVTSFSRKGSSSSTTATATATTTPTPITTATKKNNNITNSNTQNQKYKKQKIVSSMPRPSKYPSTETKLSQLNLINAYRLTHPASVDAFHAFLVSLPPGQAGNYWALIASLLSVQCRDVVALQVIKNLMKACPNGINDIRLLNAERLLPFVRSCNFCNTKVKNIITCTEQIDTVYFGIVPKDYKSLMKLRGVGPKIAHLMRSVSFGMDETGIVVDTHVHKISKALNWTNNAKNPENSRVQLQLWVPKGEWAQFTVNIVGFGQTILKKNWKEKFLQFSTEQGALEVGQDIVNRLEWSGCKFGGTVNKKELNDIRGNGSSSSSSSSNINSNSNISGSGSVPLTKEWNTQGTVLDLDCPWDTTKNNF
jgi:endonuclease-3